MTHFLRPGDPFAHTTVKKLRILLKSWGGGWQSLLSLADDKAFDGDEADVIALLHEAEETGLLEETGHQGLRLTDRGLAVATSKAGRRLPRKKALETLASIRRRAADLNADPLSPLTIECIWLVGSLLDGQREEVGDIDLAFETRHRPWVGDDFDSFQYIHETYPGLVATAGWQSHMVESHFIDRKVFGARRPRHVSRTHLTTLLDLACPCSAVFAAAGNAQDIGKILPRHPRSTGRSPHVSPPLSVGPISSQGTLNPTRIGVLASDLMHQREDVALLSDTWPGDDRSNVPWLDVPEDLDGTRSFAITFGNPGGPYARDTRRPYAIIVSRDVVTDGGLIRLSAAIRVCFEKERRRTVDGLDLAMAGRVLEILLALDVRRLESHAARRGSEFVLDITAQPGPAAGGPPDEWLETLRATARSERKRRFWPVKRCRHDYGSLLRRRSPWLAFAGVEPMPGIYR